MAEKDISVARLSKDQFEIYKDFLNDEGKTIHFRERTQVYGAFAMLPEETLVGVLLLETSYDNKSARLVSVSVSPPLQKKGIGNMMVDYSFNSLISDGIREVTVNLDADSEGISSHDGFFWRCGFSPRAVYPAVSVPLKDFKESPFFKRIAKKPGNSSNVKPLSTADDYTRRLIEKKMFHENGYTEVFSDPYIESISMIVYESGEPIGCLLCAKSYDCLTVQNLFLSKNHQDKNAVYKMILKAAEEAEQIYGPKKMLSITGTQREVQLLIETFEKLKNFTKESTTEWAATFSVTPETEEQKQDKLPYPENTGIDRFTDNGFTPLQNSELKCADCIYRTENAGDCHKYSIKPSEVIYGGSCIRYRKGVVER